MSISLIVGDEELLVSRALKELIQATPDAEVVRKDGASLEPAMVTDMLNLNLFALTQTAVITDASSMPKPALDRIKKMAPTLGAQIHLIMTCSAKASTFQKAFSSPDVKVVKVDKVSTVRDRMNFARSEAKAYGRRITDDAVRLIMDATGGDLRALSGALAQMFSQFEGTVDESKVSDFYSHSPSATGFAVAEAAVAGDPRAALEALRAAQVSGTAQVLVASALISQIRDMTRIRALGTDRPAQVAASLGMPIWKAEKLTSKLYGWSDQALASAFAHALATDGAVKGQSADPWAALERAVLSIALAKK